MVTQDMQATTPDSAFPVLAGLLNGDALRLSLVLRAIHSAISEDLSQLDLAVQRGDGRLAREAAQRAATACHLLGETATGERLAAIEKAHSGTALDPVLVQRIVRARADLAGVIERTSSFVPPGNNRSDNETDHPHQGADHG